MAKKRLFRVAIRAEGFRKHLGRYPLSIDEMIQKKWLWARETISAYDSEFRIVYIRPTREASERQVVAYDPVPDERGRITVCTVGGETTQVERSSFLDAMSSGLGVVVEPP